MKKYKVSDSLKNYVRRILTRSFYSCRMVRDETGQVWVYTNCSSNTFHRVVQRAKCEKASKEMDTFLVTKEEAGNLFLLRSLMDMANVKGYGIIDR